MYRTSPRFSLVYLFFFGVQNRFLFCLQKKKRFWPQPGRQKSDFPRKGYAPSVRRRSTHRARAVSKRHSRQETACRQRLGCGSGWASRNQQNREGAPFRQRKKQISEVPLPGGYDIRPYKGTVVGRKAFARNAPPVRRQNRKPNEKQTK